MQIFTYQLRYCTQLNIQIVVLKSQCGYFCSDISQDVHYDLFFKQGGQRKSRSKNSSIYQRTNRVWKGKLPIDYFTMVVVNVFVETFSLILIRHQNFLKYSNCLRLFWIHGDSEYMISCFNTLDWSACLTPTGTSILLPKD